MKKQTTLRSVKLLSLAFVTAITIIVGAGVSAKAQGQAKFKVDDRVECDNSGSGTYWRAGTVVPFQEGDMYNGYKPDSGYYYRLKIDGSSLDSWVCKAASMRPLATTNNGKNNDTDKKADTKTNSNADNLADREILDCDFKQPPAKNGSAPPPELAKKLIRCLLERPANPGMDGAVTVDINEFQIGKPRPWRIREDTGSADQNTIVYPILVSDTWKTFFRTRTQVIESTTYYNCFVNSLNKWTCGLAKRVKEGETKSIPRH